MYEMIMDLPLFKGVGREQVSAFLEKTNVNFVNYEDGDLIVSMGDAVRMIRFVISGEVRIIQSLKNKEIVIEEYCRHGRVLGADRLYGLSVGYPCDVMAIGKTSVMEFSKEQYLRLLKSDNIYLLNFFNFLSRRAQRPVEILEGIRNAGIGSMMSMLVGLLTDPESERIVVRASKDSLAIFCSCGVSAVEEWINDFENRGFRDCDTGKVRILPGVDLVLSKD